MIVVRFLQAFRARGDFSLLDSLKYELSTPTPIVAATGIASKYVDLKHPDRGLSLVGLLLDSKSVKKSFDGDVWSMSRSDGSLYPTRRPNEGTHNEAFCKPRYKALVLEIRVFAKRNKEFAMQVGSVYT